MKVNKIYFSKQKLKGFLELISSSFSHRYTGRYPYCDCVSVLCACVQVADTESVGLRCAKPAINSRFQQSTVAANQHRTPTDTSWKTEITRENNGNAGKLKGHTRNIYTHLLREIVERIRNQKGYTKATVVLLVFLYKTK